MIATSTMDDQTHGHIRILDGTTGRPLQKTHTNFVIDLKASPTDTALVYGVIERNAQGGIEAQRIFCYDTRTSANQVSNWVGMGEPAVRSFNIPKLPGKTSPPPPPPQIPSFPACLGQAIASRSFLHTFFQAP